MIKHTKLSEAPANIGRNQNIHSLIPNPRDSIFLNILQMILLKSQAHSRVHNQFKYPSTINEKI